MTGGIVRTDNKVIYEPEHNQPGQAGESTFCSLCRGFAEKLSSSLEQFSEVIGSLCNPGQNNAPSTEEDARALEITKKERKLERLKLDFGQAKERYNLSGQLISSIEREIMDLQDRKPQIQKSLQSSPKSEQNSRLNLNTQARALSTPLTGISNSILHNLLIGVEKLQVTSGMNSSKPRAKFLKFTSWLERSTTNYQTTIRHLRTTT